MSNLVNKRNYSDLKDFYIPYRKTLNLPSNVTFGVEIETNMKGYDSKFIRKSFFNNSASKFLNKKKAPKIWRATEEIDNTIEIVSDVLTDDENSWNDLSKVLTFLNENDAYNNGGCAAHIHAGLAIIGNDINKWELFLKLWMIYEEEIIRFTNGEYYFDRAKMNIYSKRIKKIILDLLKVNNNLLNDGLVPSSFCMQDTSICFSNEKVLKILDLSKKNVAYDKYKTIEFRCPAYTINKIIWQQNINLLLKMMLSVTNDNFDKELLEYKLENEISHPKYKYNDDKAFELCDLVFDNDYDKLCFLRQYYKDFNEPKEKKVDAKSSCFWRN